MVRLFIENHEIELTDDVQVAITSQFEELSNPTTIINDWSKTVSIPFTANNNKIFGYIYNPDKAIVDGGTVGIYFNPLLKLDFRLEWDSTVIMIGYAKLNEVKQAAGKGTYELTLFGQLGKVFQEMKKITFDKSTTDTDYLINGSEYVSEYINRDLVYDSWLSAGQYYSDLKKKNDSGYHLTDIIGFAPNNSFSEGFKYDSFQNEANGSRKFTDVLGESFEEDTGISPDTVIPNGMLPREIGEYRSYLQLPFIYWNKLFQVFQEKAEEITGYNFDLDESWFNSSNPYWYNLVYMLKPFNSKKGNTVNNQYTGASTGEIQWSKNSGLIPYSTTQQIPFTLSAVTEKAERLEDNHFVLQTYDNINVTTHTFSFYITGEMNHAHDILFTQDNCFIVYVNFVGSNGYVQTKQIAVYRDGTENTDVLAAVAAVQADGGYVYPILDDNKWGTVQPISGTSSTYGWHITVSGENLINLKKYIFGDTVSITVTGHWINNHTVFGAAVGSSISELCWLSNVSMIFKMEIIQDVFNSQSYFNLNDLWNNDYNLFDEILKYCKMYRIGISVDEYEKKIIFKPFTKYFETYSILDWTNKIDKSKDYVITPVTLENKYILFNYDDSKTKLAEHYKEKFGVNFAEYRLVTEYNFNTNTKKLFDKVKTSITNTDNVLSWTNIYDNHKIVYSFPAEIFVYNKDKDNKQVDIFGSYYFHNGVRAFSTEASLNLRPVCISDDTAFQQANNTYMYSQAAGNLRYLTSYPALDIVRGDNMCLFNVPSENYTYINNYSGKNSIYTNLWKNYIDERYNVQNKKITCYVNLNPSEYNQFDWNKFVLIDRQLCIVNKIYDYDITSNGNTKVDLITIQDVNGYNHNDYTYDYIISSDHELTIPYDYFKEITIKSSGKWEIHADDWGDNLTAFPTSGTSGETRVIIGSTNQTLGGVIIFDLLNEDETEVIGSDYCRVSVGGTGNLSVTPWFNEISVGNSATVQMSAGTPWSVYKIDKHGNENRKVLTYPSMASTGTYNLTITVPSDSATGVVDVYLKQMNGDLITSYRVNIVA